MAIAPSLRSLAKGYAGGQIDQAKYRAERNAFIEAVLAGTVTIKAVAGIPASLSSESRVSSSDKTTLMGSDGAAPAYTAMANYEPLSSAPEKNKTGLIIGIAAAVIVVIGIAIFALGGDESDSGSAPTAAAPANTPAPAATPAIGLVTAFLSTNNWSQPSIDNFVADWNRLSATDQSALTGSIELGQLTNAIYKKLLEERALSGIGNPETSYAKQRILVEFAGQIGIKDNRITLPEPPSATGTP